MNSPSYLFAKRLLLVCAGVMLLTGVSTQAFAQDAYLGELRLVAFNFAPSGWALCNGQILPISSNSALFSLLGTTYGGNGTTTFALPDLRGRVPISAGTGPGLSTYVQGETGGAETHTLTIAQMPAHTHTISADTSIGSTDRPSNALPARNAAGIPQYGTSATTQLSGVQTVGSGQSHNIRQPYLTLYWIIATQGIFPPRPSDEPSKPSEK